MKKKWLVISALAIINVACFLLFFFMARTVYDNSSVASKELYRIIYAVEQNKSNENFKTDKYSFTIQQSAPITKLYDRQYTYYVTDTETGGKNERYVFMKYENTKQNTTKVYVSSRMNSKITDWTYEKYAVIYILLAAVDTFILYPCNFHAAFDTYIIFLCFKAVILTSCNTKFELMRKFSSEIMFVKLLCK